MNDQSAEWVPALIKSGQESFAGIRNQNSKMIKTSSNLSWQANGVENI